MTALVAEILPPPGRGILGTGSTGWCRTPPNQRAPSKETKHTTTTYSPIVYHGESNTNIWHSMEIRAESRSTCRCTPPSHSPRGWLSAQYPSRHQPRHSQASGQAKAEQSKPTQQVSSQHCRSCCQCRKESRGSLVWRWRTAFKQKSRVGRPQPKSFFAWKCQAK